MAKKKKKDKKIPVLLLEDVVNLGQQGEVVLVKPGYFRYLILCKKAILATKEKLEKELKPLILEEKIRSREVIAQKIKEQIENIVLEFKINKYSGVGKEKIFQALKQKNLAISKGSIEIKEKIKKEGEYIIPINLGFNIKANLKVKCLN